MSGYILESRKILDSEIWKKPPLYFKVWHYLLLKAQFKDSASLKRGQLIVSIPEIQEACSYYIGYRKVTPTKKEIYSVINWLRNPCEGETKGNNERGMIVTTKVTHGMLVTICNFNVYQNPTSYEGNNETDTKGTTRRTRRERQGNNNIKEREERKNEDIYRGFGFSDPVIDALVDFEEMRKKIKSPLTSERAIRTLCNKLVKLSGGDERIMVAMLNESISQNWKSVYPLKDDAVIEAADQSTEIKERIKELETELTDVEAAMVRATDRHQYGELKLRKSWLEDSIRKLREKIA